MHSIRKPTGWNAFYQSVAPDVQKQLSDGAGIGKISTVVGRMWKKLPADRRKYWKDKAQSIREDLDTGMATKNKCASCQTEFSRSKDLKYHEKGCHPCVCNECNETFDHENKLRRHINKKHAASLKCGDCGKTFAEKRNLIRHSKSHQ
ncbi:zinc finger protein 287 [Nematostella vectensis]|uniref:zinc finger protein 287 n=1 Tax=Nematostella vectensis TaxID=45351 RepID=UPI00138FF1E4|nr:zinc finger protein 287 [Nematostella vectensis]